MKQNIFYAVMQQRHSSKNGADFFPTPPWATRALCDWLVLRIALQYCTVLEPACGDGAMAHVLKSYFAYVKASDLHDYGYGTDGIDFLLKGPDQPADWIITNAPFKLAEKFILTALDRARIGVAIFARSSFAEGVGRYARLFKPWPPLAILQFTERVTLVKGRLDPTVSSATSYAWFVWRLPCNPMDETEFHWIPPCRNLLERPSDYA